MQQQNRGERGRGGRGRGRPDESYKGNGGEKELLLGPRFFMMYRKEEQIEAIRKQNRTDTDQTKKSPTLTRGGKAK